MTNKLVQCFYLKDCINKIVLIIYLLSFKCCCLQQKFFFEFYNTLQVKRIV
jgi:hypothetical protein